MRNVSSEQVAVAQSVNVYELARTRLADAFDREGSGLRLKSDHKIFISAGKDRYFDNRTGMPGNAVDLLTRYFGYSFVDAVELLCGEAGVLTVPSAASVSKDPAVLPERAEGSFKNVFAYLMSRGIPGTVVQRLIDMGLLYQSAEHNNAVFVNAEGTYAEIRGTYTLGGKPFKQSLGTKAGNFWCVPALKTAETVFVCEAAIDAVSLSILRSRAKLPKAVYVSIGGVGNVGAIETLVHKGKHVIIATDNDAAGEGCKAHFPALEHITPVNKDWNEDLQQGVEYNGK